MVDKHVFFPVKWQDKKAINVEDAERSIAVHEFASMGGRSKGSLFDVLKKDMARYTPCKRPAPNKTRKQKRK
jgi:hypothetical protein